MGPARQAFSQRRPSQAHQGRLQRRYALEAGAIRGRSLCTSLLALTLGKKPEQVALDTGYGWAGERERVVGDAAPGVYLIGVVRRAAMTALAAGDARQAVVPIATIGDE